MLPGHCEVGTEQRRDRDQLPRPARPRPPQRAPHPAYPLGHLMLGGSFRNQGRYLWNCSTVGRTGPSVRLTQFLRQAREAGKTAGALGSSSRRARWPLMLPMPSRPGHVPLAGDRSPCAPEHSAFLSH